MLKSSQDNEKRHFEIECLIKIFKPIRLNINILQIITWTIKMMKIRVQTALQETCTKAFVNNSINIDMKRFSEFSVLNLSDYSLNQTDLRLLSKGLTFTPTPDVVNMGEIKSDLDRFLRKIRLTLYFSKEISEDDTIASTSPNLATQSTSEFKDKLIRKFRNKSNWSPKNQDANVEIFIKTIVTEFQKLEPWRRPKNNLTKDETQRLKLLQNNKHIVIKPADKGSAIVIMNRTDYITEATR